jgi:hypothetical protein
MSTVSCYVHEYTHLPIAAAVVSVMKEQAVAKILYFVNICISCVRGGGGQLHYASSYKQIFHAVQAPVDVCSCEVGQCVHFYYTAHFTCIIMGVLYTLDKTKTALFLKLSLPIPYCE